MQKLGYLTVTGRVNTSFFKIYEEDKKKRVKENKWVLKSHIIRTKIFPFFVERKIAEIEPKDVIAW